MQLSNLKEQENTIIFPQSSPSNGDEFFIFVVRIDWQGAQDWQEVQYFESMEHAVEFFNAENPESFRLSKLYYDGSISDLLTKINNY